MKKPERCSFCGRTEAELKGGLMAGPGGAAICRNCVTICDTLFTRNGYPADQKPAAAPSEGEEPADGEEDEEVEYDGVMYDVTCPSCGEEISFDEETREKGSIKCPNCGEVLEFDLGEDKE